MFRVGQKVVCVDDGNPSSHARDGVVFTSSEDKGSFSQLSVGDIYTIRDVIETRVARCGFGVRLDEICREFEPAIGAEAFFAASRFRPVQEKGIEMLRAILVHPKSPVKEDA